MKIYVNARFLTQPISGVQRYGIECSLQIKKLYPEAVFITPSNIFHKSVAKELEAVVVGKNSGHLWEQTDLPSFLRRQQSPALFNPGNTAPYFYGNNFVTLHDLAFHHFPQWNSKAFSVWYNTLIPRVVRKARHVFTVSETVRGEISENYKVPTNKISVTYNGISADMLADPLVDIKKEKIILSVGTFNIRKNHHNLIRAFLESDLRKTYQLVLAGDKNKIFKEISIDEQELKAGNVKLVHRLTNDELREMYKKAEVVASLSAYEGFGIPLLEGLYYGCKIACSDIPVYKELFDGYAHFCSPFDRNSINDALGAAANAKNGNDIEVLLEKYNYGRSAQIILDRMLAAQ
jgi:glycosyltransferase involved in cell wall biosynthesis